MDNQTKFVLTVDVNGTVVKVQQLGEDGSLSEMAVLEFFSELIVPDSGFSGSGTLTVQPSQALGPAPGGPVIHPSPLPHPPPSPPGPPAAPKRPPSVPDVKKT